MAKVTLKGNEIHTNGELPKVGTEAPDFKGVKSDLSELSLRVTASELIADILSPISMTLALTDCTLSASVTAVDDRSSITCLIWFVLVLFASASAFNEALLSVVTYLYM